MSPIPVCTTTKLPQYLEHSSTQAATYAPAPRLQHSFATAGVTPSPELAAPSADSPTACMTAGRQTCLAFWARTSPCQRCTPGVCWAAPLFATTRTSLQHSASAPRTAASPTQTRRDRGAQKRLPHLVQLPALVARLQLALHVVGLRRRRVLLLLLLLLLRSRPAPALSAHCCSPTRALYAGPALSRAWRDAAAQATRPGAMQNNPPTLLPAVLHVQETTQLCCSTMHVRPKRLCTVN